MTAIVRTKKGNYAGHIENKIFIKEVYGSKHMLRNPMAWSIDADIFDSVISHNCLSIHVIDKETNKRYAVGVDTFRQNKGLLNRGFGKQYYLDMAFWRVQ